MGGSRGRRSRYAARSASGTIGKSRRRGSREAGLLGDGSSVEGEAGCGQADDLLCAVREDGVCEMSRTPTETILAVMEEFGQIEPRDCMVIWTDEGGDICWSCSTDSQAIKMGMVEMVKSLIVKQI